MEPMPSMSWKKLAAALQGKFEETLDHVADVVKDTMLDSEPTGGRNAGLPVPGDLPPLAEDEFLEALEPRLEATIWRAMEVINGVGPGDSLAQAHEAVADLFAALAWETFNAGIRQRIKAAAAGDVPSGPDSWAARYRRMKLLETAFPLARSGDGN
jgi:hypothetical protein